MKKYGREWVLLRQQPENYTDATEWWFAMKVGDDLIFEENAMGCFILIDGQHQIWVSIF